MSDDVKSSSIMQNFETMGKRHDNSGIIIYAKWHFQNKIHMLITCDRSEAWAQSPFRYYEYADSVAEATATT